MLAPIQYCAMKSKYFPDLDGTCYKGLSSPYERNRPDTMRNDGIVKSIDYLDKNVESGYEIEAKRNMSSITTLLSATGLVSNISMTMPYMQESNEKAFRKREENSLGFLFDTNEVNSFQNCREATKSTLFGERSPRRPPGNCNERRSLCTTAENIQPSISSIFSGENVRKTNSIEDKDSSVDKSAQSSIRNQAPDEADDDADSEITFQGQPFYLDEDDLESTQSEAMYRSFSNKPYLKYSNSVAKRSCRPSILSPSLFPNVPPYLNYSSYDKCGPLVPEELRPILKFKLSPKVPKVVRKILSNTGFRLAKTNSEWIGAWRGHLRAHAYKGLRSFQKYNHMPGSVRMGRKDYMWRNIRHMIRTFGVEQFGFMQQTYIIPYDMERLRRVWHMHAAKMTKWIVKPPAGGRGYGIHVINKWSQFSKKRVSIIQRYIEHPFLINDNKFDLRLYVVLTSVNPLRIYMHKEGLVRFACKRYDTSESHLCERCVHLTNYSINKHSKHYKKNPDINTCTGHKWTLQSLWSWLESRGFDTKLLWAKLRDLVIKTIISAESDLVKVYQETFHTRYHCFELYGFDVLLDADLVPWLLEVNSMPSLNSGQKLDLYVKGSLMQAIFNTALYQVPPKLSKTEQKEIIGELQLPSDTKLCFDNRIFTLRLSNDEKRKHSKFFRRKSRSAYVDEILEDLKPDDIRCLVIHEDELHRCRPLECIFPTCNSFKYLKFISSTRYYNRLLDAWEAKYGHCRALGIALLTEHCNKNDHLKVPVSKDDPEPENLHEESSSENESLSENLSESSSEDSFEITMQHPEI